MGAERETVRFLVFGASLRADSLNVRLAATAAEVIGAHGGTVDGAKMAEFDAPSYNQDEQTASGFPPGAVEFRRRVEANDALVIASPEYNFSIPGVFKNVIDWVSRGEDQPFANKPVAILSATPGPLGGARVQYDLRRVMLFVNAMVLVKPEIFIGGAGGKFDAEGNCTDETTRKFVGDQMKSFEKWIGMVKRMA